ncbi:hypothetical protein ACH4M4_02880 [Streptomyces sp. NPDC017254]|uniref:hypothetical protein n=1 Tax=unclassified Streptomyces TaxID=2593676 RepID=UPI00379AC5D6
MNSEEPRQGRPTPPAYPPAGQGRGGYDGYDGYGGGYGAPAPTAPVVQVRTSSHRGAWIGAGATMVAAVIGVVGTYMVSGNNAAPPQAQTPVTSATPSATEAGGGDDAPADSSRGTDSAQSTATPGTDSTRSPEPQAPRSPAGKPAGTIEWQGALAITFTDSKDLDSAPPVESEIREENDFSIYPFGSIMLRPEGGAKALVWKDTAKAPSYADCAGVIETLGTSGEIKVKTGMVLCASTNDGRVARLTVKELNAQSSDTRGVFDVVVWSH